MSKIDRRLLHDLWQSTANMNDYIRNELQARHSIQLGQQIKLTVMIKTPNEKIKDYGKMNYIFQCQDCGLYYNFPRDGIKEFRKNLCKKCFGLLKLLN